MIAPHGGGTTTDPLAIAIKLNQYQHGITDTLEAHSVMSTQALESQVVREGLKAILFGPGQLYEALRQYQLLLMTSPFLAGDAHLSSLLPTAKEDAINGIQEKLAYTLRKSFLGVVG